MRYIEILPKLQEYQVFSFRDIAFLDDAFNKSKLSSWVKKGYIAPVIRGYYRLASVSINSNLLYKIANTIYSPSYLSCESVLSMRGIIPEGVFVVTSISTKKTQKFETDLGRFQYQSLRPDLFWGYEVQKIHSISYRRAKLEKALLDYLYLHSEIKNLDDISGLRWNKDILLEKLDMPLLEKYARAYNSKKMLTCYHLIYNYLSDAGDFEY